MYNEPYKILTELVAEARFWPIYREIRNLSSEMQVKYLEEILQISIEKHDDEKTAKYFSWIMKALDDNEIAPFLQEVEDRAFFFSSSLEVSAAKLRAYIARAAKAIEIYSLLPKLKTEKAHQRYASDPDTVQVPTLLETKKAVLAEITQWWRSTKDEEAADRLFDFLISVESKANKAYVTKEADGKIIREAIRTATNCGFSPNRLVRCFLKIVPPGSEHSAESSEVAQILAIAWARNSKLEQLSLVHSVTNMLRDCSPAAFDFVARTANSLAKLDAEAQKLKTAMQPEDSWNPPIPGKIDISYHVDGSMKILISMTADNRFEENKGHDYFQKAEKYVEQWKKDRHFYIKITLILKVQSKFTSEKEPLFSRERTL